MTYRYRNVVTGIVITTSSPVQGKNWEQVVEPAPTGEVETKPEKPTTRRTTRQRGK